MVEVQCPIGDCDYTGPVRSVEAHISGSQREGHKGHHGLGYRQELREQAEEQGRARAPVDEPEDEETDVIEAIVDDVEDAEATEDVDDVDDGEEVAEVEVPATSHEGEMGTSPATPDEGEKGASTGASYILIATVLFVLGAYLSGRASTLDGGEAGDETAEQSGGQDGVTTLIS